MIKRDGDMTNPLMLFRANARVRTHSHKLAMRRLFAEAGPEIHVEFQNPRVGFFAQMNFCLNMAYYAEQTGRRVSITLSSCNYRDPSSGSNWLHYFFEEKNACTIQDPAKKVLIFDSCELPFNTDKLELEEAHTLFFKYFAIKQGTLDLIDQKCRTIPITGNTLGVHFRGTDKYTEANSVDYSFVLEEIDEFLKKNPQTDKVFVASDDAAFVKRCHNYIRAVPVASLADSVRSEGLEPVHLGGLRIGNKLMAQDALINSIILSRCARLMRTTSFLSAWSCIFNPKLPVLLLNQPKPNYLWFPETRILDRATRLYSEPV